MLWAAYKIRKEDGGPVFFSQERIGQCLRPFVVYKFRTMVVGADEQRDRLLQDKVTEVSH